MKNVTVLVMLLVSLSHFLLGGENAILPSLKVGDSAPDFTLKTLDDKALTLSQLTRNGKVVLVALRGYPGYQCPICTKQVREFLTNASEFSDKKLQILMIYPGPADQLKEHAQEFLKDKAWPKEWNFVLDPDYSFTKLYQLRWEKEKETLYPSTFVIDQKSKILYAKISTTHGGRPLAREVLDASAK